MGALTVGSNGTLFGATQYGGRVNKACRVGCGTVFSLAPPEVSGGTWTAKILYAFNPEIGDGWDPWTGLVISPTTGVLYGTTYAGGSAGFGTVFSVNPPAIPGEPMTETTLYSFTESDGSSFSSLVLGPNGALYGTTHGGPGNGGTVFELAPPASPGGSWTKTVLHSFPSGTGGYYPNALTLGPDGILYGTTYVGGTWDVGTVYSLTP